MSKPSEGYVEGLRADMREAVRMFRKFDARWNKLNDELNLKWRREHRDMMYVDQAKAVNITLKGHMSAAQWWRDKAAMLAAVISAEEAADLLLRDE